MHLIETTENFTFDQGYSLIDLKSQVEQVDFLMIVTADGSE